MGFPLNSCFLLTAVSIMTSAAQRYILRKSGSDSKKNDHDYFVIRLNLVLRHSCRPDVSLVQGIVTVQVWSDAIQRHLFVVSTDRACPDHFGYVTGRVSTGIHATRLVTADREPGNASIVLFAGRRPNAHQFPPGYPQPDADRRAHLGDGTPAGQR